jgi:hypothetical protein
MNAIQPSEAAQTIGADPTHPTTPGPSLQRASLLFVVSISSFIGASLVLASI